MDEVDGMAGNEDRGGMNVCHNNSSLFFFTLPFLPDFIIYHGAFWIRGSQQQSNIV